MTAKCAGLWAVVIVAAACATAPPTNISSLDIQVRVLADGGVDVRETLVVDVVDGVGRRVVRRVGPDRVEAVKFRGAVVDDQAVTSADPGEVDVHVERGRALELTWRPTGALGIRRLEWSYHADGALAVEGVRGTLRHAVLSGRLSSIAAARIQLVVPETMHVFDGTGIAEAGWRVSRTPDGILAERRDLAPGTAATLVAELGVDPALVQEPAWQRHELWGRQLVPAFISGGLFILVIGVGVLWIIRFQYPRRKATDEDRKEREAVRRGLRTTAFVALALAVVLAGITMATLSHLGIWPQAIAVSVGVVGIVFLAVAKRIV